MVPHFMEYDEIFKEYGSRYDVIDIRTDDVESFIDQIIDSDYILSTSLHGIIIAHAYGIPALWIKKDILHLQDLNFMIISVLSALNYMMVMTIFKKFFLQKKLL